MSPPHPVAVALGEQAKRAAEERHRLAVEAAKEIEKNAINPCPLDVESMCRQTEQDEVEKKYDIAPGCGYYRKRYNDFIARNPGRTPPDYYLNYGEKYCNRFSRETYDKLSPEGKKWFDGVKCGLQKGIEDILQNPELRYREYLNKDFAEQAFEMHAPTYLDNGLAKLPEMDLLNIAKTPWEEFVPGLGDHLADTYGQALDVLPHIIRDILIDRSRNMPRGIDPLGGMSPRDMGASW